MIYNFLHYTCNVSTGVAPGVSTTWCMAGGNLLVLYNEKGFKIKIASCH